MHPTSSVKALKETQSTGPNQWPGLILSSSTTVLLTAGALLSLCPLSYGCTKLRTMLYRLKAKLKEAYLSIQIDFLYLYYKLLISRRTGMAPVNKESHSCQPHVYPQVEWTIPAFYPKLQSVAALWLVLIFHPTEGRRLSWPGWLDEILRWCVCPKTVTHPGICDSGRELNPQLTSRESNAITTRPPRHLSSLSMTHKGSRHANLCAGL